jgi:PAS domain S-box-containing protein
MKYKFQFALLFLLLALCLYLFFSFYEDAKRKAIDGMNAGQLMHARQAAAGIEATFEDLIGVLTMLSRYPHVADLDESGRLLLRETFDRHRDTVAILSRVDGDGRVLFSVPEEALAPGTDLGRMDHMKRLKSSQRPVVSDVIRSPGGFDAIAVQVPVFRRERFDGSVAFIIPFEVIARRYLANIRIGESGYAWLLSEKGIELYCPVPGHAGNSIFENCRDNPSVLAMAREMLQGRAGIATYTIDGPGENAARNVKKHAVFMPIRLGNTFWSIVVATPENDILALMTGFRNRLAGILAVLFLGTALFSYLGSRAWGIVREEKKRREAEESLQKSEGLTATLIATIPDVMIRTDMAGTILFVSESAQRVGGYDRSEIEGRNMLEFMAPEDRQRAVENSALMLQGRLGPREYHLVTKDGRKVLFEINGDVLRDSEGSPYGLVHVCRDISERRQAEEKLLESERRYRTFIDSTTEMVFLKDDRFRHLIANRALCSFFGRDESDVIGRTDFELMPETAAAECHRSDAEALSSRSVRIQEQETGGRCFETLKFPVELSGGNLGVGGFIRDITDRKQMEERLRKVSKEWEIIFHAIGHPTLILAPDCTILAANRTAADALKKSPEEIVGKTCYELFHLTGAPPPQCPLQKTVSAGRAETAEIRVEAIGRDCLVSSTPVYDEGGNLEKVIHIATDVTEKVIAERALRESEKKYREIFEEAIEGIYQYTPEGRFITVNPALARMAGYESPEEMVSAIADIGRDLYVRREDRLEFREIIERDGIVSGFETEFHKKGGGTVFAVLSARCVRDGRGNVLHYEGIAEDVTNRKRLESQLLHAQKMEAIGTLAGGIAHDFNNILMGILGHASLLAMETAADGPRSDRVKGIEALVQSGAHLTRQLLGFARGGPQDFKPVDLNEILEKTATLFGRTKKDVTVHRKYERDLWTVEADRGQIEQVLMNLFVNAWQAMPAGGDLYLETANTVLDGKYVEPYRTAPGRYVRVSVTDTGVGMDEKTKERLFEPFFTTREAGRGTGLGLSIVYGIVRNHNGMINVYSEKGHGTTFHVYLPASQKEVQRKTGFAEAPLRGTETLLIVDDEDVIVNVTKEMLESLGYRVLAARSGQEAIGIYEAGRKEIALVILDMVMPGMGGEETFERLKKIDGDVKVILSSGYSRNGQVGRIMEGGCRAFLQKPFLMADLSRTVREVLEAR